MLKFYQFWRTIPKFEKISKLHCETIERNATKKREISLLLGNSTLQNLDLADLKTEIDGKSLKNKPEMVIKMVPSAKKLERTPEAMAISPFPKVVKEKVVLERETIK